MVLIVAGEKGGNYDLLWFHIDDCPFSLTPPCKTFVKLFLPFLKRNHFIVKSNFQLRPIQKSIPPVFRWHLKSAIRLLFDFWTYSSDQKFDSKAASTCKRHHKIAQMVEQAPSNRKVPSSNPS